MERPWKYFVILLAAFCAFILWWIFTITEFEWVDFYNEKSDFYDEKKILLLDAISVQVTILQTLLAIGGLVLAILGFWGYQKISDFTDKQTRLAVQRIADEKLIELVNAELNKRDLPQRPAAEPSVTGKEEDKS